MAILIFFNYLNFQVVEVNVLYEIVLRKPCLAVAFKLGYCFVQPHRPPQVKTAAYFIQSAEDLVRPGIGTAVLNAGVLQHAIVFKSPCP